MIAQIGLTKVQIKAGMYGTITLGVLPLACKLTGQVVARMLGRQVDQCDSSSMVQEPDCRCHC